MWMLHLMSETRSYHSHCAMHRPYIRPRGGGGIPTTGLRERGNNTSRSTGCSSRQMQRTDAACEGKHG